MSARIPGTPLLAGVALVSAGAVAMGLVSQHVYDMLPCPWCVLQRFIFTLIALLALLCLGVRAVAGSAGSRRIATQLAALAIVLLAASGIAAAFWQHFVATKSATCNLTLADRIMAATGLDQWLPNVYAAWASCADAAVSLLGLPYEFYSVALFVALIGAAVLLWRGAGAAGAPAFR